MTTTTKTTGTTAAAPDAVVELLRELRLPHMRHAAPDLLATAKARRWDPAEAVRALLTEEIAGRRASSIGTRRKAAGFPTGKTFDAWNETTSSIPAPTQAALRTLEWIGNHENLVICGPSGTGKTHFLEALGHAAVDAGAHVLWFSLEQLGQVVRRHRADDTTGRALRRILRADLILLDELGYVQLDGRGSELLFQILTEREERASVAVATNLPFSEWGTVIPDPRLVAAIVDRLTFNAHIIETGTDSYRLRTTKTRTRRRTA